MDKPLKFDIVFTNPPGPTQTEQVCEFVEVEGRDGKSIEIGTWLERSDGMWVLAVDLTPDLDPMLQAIANFVMSAKPSTPFEELQEEVIGQLVEWVNNVRGASKPTPLVPPTAQAAVDHWSDNKSAPEYQPEDDEPEDEPLHLARGAWLRVRVDGTDYRVEAPNDGEGGIAVSKVEK